MKNFLQVGILGATIAATGVTEAKTQTPHPNDVKPVTVNTFSGKTIEEVCRTTQGAAKIIMDKSENAMVACNNNKPAFPYILRATHGKKITPTGTFKVDYFKNEGVIPHGMHVNTRIGKNAIFIHQGRIWEKD